VRDPDFEMVGAPIGVRKGAGAGTVGVGVEGEATGEPYGGTSVARGVARTRDPVAGVSVGALRAGVRVLCILLLLLSRLPAKACTCGCPSTGLSLRTNEYQVLICMLGSGGKARWPHPF